MTRTFAKGQGERSLSLKVRMETDGWTDVIALSLVLTRSVNVKVNRYSQCFLCHLSACLTKCLYDAFSF